MISKYQLTHECKAGRTWFTQKYVIENFGPDVLNKIKSDKDMIEGVTHKIIRKAVYSRTEPGGFDTVEEWCFCKELLDLTRKELAYERLKRREGRYKVNGKDYPGYVMCFIVRGQHHGLRRLVIAHANNYITYLNTRKRTVIDAIVFCKRIESANRKFLFQRLHEHCDELFDEETARMSSQAMIEKYLGLEPIIPVITKPPSEHTYLVPQEFYTGKLKSFMEEQLSNFKKFTKCTIKKNGVGARRKELPVGPTCDL